MISTERTPVLMTWGDYHLLKSLASNNTCSGSMTFADEFNRAILVQDYAFPPHAIRLYSKVSLRVESTRELRQFTIVPPAEADELSGKISVLDPLATAIFGFREGETISWTFAEEAQILKIQEVKNEMLPFEIKNSSPVYIS
jgi:regulator of nucleoside diphosphate kinase